MKFGRVAIWMIVVLALVGCRPRGVLSSRELRIVLIDLHKADAVLQVAGYNYGHDEEVAKAYQIVLAKHGLTQAQFDSTIVWYTDHPQLFDKVYPKVVRELEAEQALREEQERANSTIAVVARDLRPIEDVMDEMQHGLPVNWRNVQKEIENMQKNAEKFVYVEIN